MAFRYIAVAGADQPGALHSYLYPTARAYDESWNTAGTAAIVKVSGGDNVQYLAEYQAQRLQSGLWFARVFETYAAAVSDEDFLYVAQRYGWSRFTQTTNKEA